MRREDRERLCQQIKKLHGYCKRRWDKKTETFIHVGECKVERKDMGGFANLKNDFEQNFKILDPFVNGQQGTVEKKQQDAFRFLYLRCLFEIAGNLDTIALCSRALVEQSDKRNRINEAGQENFEKVRQTMMEAVKELISRPAPVMPTIPVPDKKGPKKR